MYKNYAKRLIDVLFSFIGLICVSPLLLICTMFLLVANDRKAFFFQTRPGKNGKPFRIIKFKTMNDKKDKEGNLLPDAARITPIGAFVRNTSLDELPQLVNVLKGDISLVGPRPLLMEYLPLYNKEQARRHEVKPGITGWAQVNGRNAISWEEKFKLDVYYVENLSIRLDMKIVFWTIKKVFVAEGINSKGQATTIKFKGIN